MRVAAPTVIPLDEATLPAEAVKEQPEPRTGRAAFVIGIAIFASKILGLAREIAFARFFGNSAAADAWRVAFRLPNLLQNLFGETALSGSFIPVYAGLMARGQREEAARVASAVLALLASCVTTLVLIGVVGAPVFVAIGAPGFTGEKRDLTIHLVRILFPGAGILVLSAWCLGILNSHRRFFLAYTAPVLWNVAMIGALLLLGPGRTQERLVVLLAWASVLGSILQFAVQLPLALRLVGDLRPTLGRGVEGVRTVVRNFGPVFMSRGVGQISGWIDIILATLIVSGAAAALGYAQMIYMLPVTLFGMSVSAAELPEMASLQGAPEEVAARLRRRLDGGLRRIAFFVIPSAVAFLLLGDVIVAAVYERGAFTRADTLWVWAILGGSAAGLLAATLGRMYSSTFYAVGETRTPLRFAIVRVVLTAGLGFLLAFPVRRALGIDPRWAVAGLTISSGIAAWVEYSLLRSGLNRRIGRTGLRGPIAIRLWLAAGLAAAVAWGARYLLPDAMGGASLGVASLFPGAAMILFAVLVLGIYGLAYLAISAAFGIEEVGVVTQKVRRRLGR